VKDNKIKILLVEDDTNMGFLLAEYLETHGFDVKLYRDGETGFKGFQNGHFDFCILDIMLPKLDGFSLAKKIKAANKHIPIILLTAKSLKEDKIRGFNIGIDDYITKPFDEEELLCRINAILKRVNFEKEKITKNIFAVGKYILDYTNQALIFNEKTKRLTVKENEILRLLCMSKNKIMKREDVLTSVWNVNDYFTSRSLDVFISKLRKYLNNDPAVKIESIPRVGIILSDC